LLSFYNMDNKDSCSYCENMASYDFSQRGLRLCDKCYGLLQFAIESRLINSKVTMELPIPEKKGASHEHP